MNDKPIQVFCEWGSTEDLCDLGEKHVVTYYGVKTITPTSETREHDNGYEKRQTPLYTDAQGRVYHQHVQIDYFNNVSYCRYDDGQRFYPRVLRRPARDLLGNLL